MYSYLACSAVAELKPSVRLAPLLFIDRTHLSVLQTMPCDAHSPFSSVASRARFISDASPTDLNEKFTLHIIYPPRANSKGLPSLFSLQWWIDWNVYLIQSFTIKHSFGDRVTMIQELRHFPQSMINRALDLFYFTDYSLIKQQTNFCSL